MIIKSNYIFLSSINDLYTYLLTGQINNNIYKYYDKIIIKHFVYDTNNRESLRIWKSNSVLDL